MKRKQAEQEPLYVRWRGDLRELVPFISEHASCFSIVERFGDYIKSFRMVPNDGASRNLIEEWLEEHGTIIPPEVKLQRNFRKQPSLKEDRVDEAPPPPEGIIEGLNGDWEYFQKKENARNATQEQWGYKMYTTIPVARCACMRARAENSYIQVEAHISEKSSTR